MSDAAGAVAGRQAKDEDDSLGNLFKDKFHCLSDILSSIEQEANSRRRLSEVLLVEIQSQYCYLKTKLFELYERGLGVNRNLDSRRSRLEIQLDKLNEESREERVRAWQDVENLSKEWRTWFKQYCDLVQRLKIVGIDVRRAESSATNRARTIVDARR
ncbi:MAG: hypothetical protein HY459_01345 [Parcubacteria group bacterium]|nr:hypothetical protein [Parcubacteria group bacterium]